MNGAIAGFGTKFYGKGDSRSDGSYIATKWIVFAYIPIFPLGSFLVKHTGHDYSSFEASSLLAARVRWQRQHIFNVYAAMGFVAVVLLTLNYVSGGRSPNSTASTSSPTPARTKDGYIRSNTAQNGSPFPSYSAYIEGYEKLANEGYAQMKINNEKNNYDLYAKLYALDRGIEEPVRVFFVKARSYFIVDSLDAGDYELRYQNLDTGWSSKTERLSLEKIEEDSGFYFTGLELTLSRVVDGNLRTEPILEEDF